MSGFLKHILFTCFIILCLNTTYVFSSNNKFLETFHSKEDLIFQENKQPISKQTINEIKKSQILLVIIITFFVFGFLFLIYHLKKVSIINKQLKNYAQENEFLISETNHRVNNNLQLISLLISETLRKKQSEENKKDFIRLQAKVDSIALLHRHLYTSNNVNTVNLKKYLTEVKNNFSPVEYEQKLKVNLEIDTIEIQSDYAMYIGLLITELVINSIKHAFDKTQEKIIQIKLIKEEKGVIFDYQDNGKNAIDKTIQPKLVNQLCQQLLVNSIIETQNGFHLNFKLNL